MLIQNHTLSLKTQRREQFISITDEINQIIKKSGAQSGSVKIFCPHTTAGLTINENADPDVVKDIMTILDEAVPHQRRYLHSEGNSDAHAKASLMGAHLELLIENGALLLGQWQGIFFCEFDGPRTRKLWIQIIGLN